MLKKIRTTLKTRTVGQFPEEEPQVPPTFIITAFGESIPCLKLIKATYGFGDQQKDVTDVILQKMKIRKPSIQVENDLLGDPAFGLVKDITITLENTSRRVCEIIVKENSDFQIEYIIPSETMKTETPKTEISKPQVQNDSLYLNGVTKTLMIGKGAFGEVWLGMWKSVQVALKNFVVASTEQRENELLNMMYKKTSAKIFEFLSTSEYCYVLWTCQV